MGILKQRLESALQASKPERSRPDHKNDPREQKKVARQMYMRRRLSKDINNYVNNNDPILYKEIVKIQDKHDG